MNGKEVNDMQPKYIKEHCLDCKKETLHRYRTHNQDEIIMICSECGVKLYVGFDIATVRKFKTLEEIGEV